MTRVSHHHLEVLPGITVWQMLLKDWKGEDVNQIGALEHILLHQNLEHPCAGRKTIISTLD